MSMLATSWDKPKSKKWHCSRPQMYRSDYKSQTKHWQQLQNLRVDHNWLLFGHTLGKHYSVLRCFFHGFVHCLRSFQSDSVLMYTGPAHSQGQCTLVLCQRLVPPETMDKPVEKTPHTEPVLPTVLCVDCGRATMEWGGNILISVTCWGRWGCCHALWGDSWQLVGLCLSPLTLS